MPCPLFVRMQNKCGDVCLEFYIHVNYLLKFATCRNKRNNLQV